MLLSRRAVPVRLTKEEIPQAHDNSVSICDVLTYGAVVCHVQRGTAVLKSTETLLTQRSDGSQLQNQDKS
ncbi:hypothetical protein NQZ68_027328 [Dissostichus eleginoides]|nr:hypothetical protein NQZ68_027328 [Dissostichus eleginoides]